MKGWSWPNFWANLVSFSRRPRHRYHNLRLLMQQGARGAERGARAHHHGSQSTTLLAMVRLRPSHGR
jgi:hypothetical protein